MTCAKRTVTAILITPEGRRFTGTNAVRNPQKVCPRAENSSRDDYRLCREICAQHGHAEVMALRLAGPWASGATMWVDHWRSCDACEQQMQRAGVRQVILGRPPAERGV